MASLYHGSCRKAIYNFEEIKTLQRTINMINIYKANEQHCIFMQLCKTAIFDISQIQNNYSYRLIFHERYNKLGMHLIPHIKHSIIMLFRM